jgi:type III secretion protein Q
VALPFDLPRISRGFAALDPSVLAAGAETAAAAARAVGEVLGLEVRIAGRPLPAEPAPASGTIQLALELPALPATALLEVDALLAAEVVAAISGGAAPPAAGAATPLEEGVLELLALAAVDGARAVPCVDERLAPRLARQAPAPGSPLAVELAVSAGPVRGGGRLLLPAAAIDALRAATVADDALLAISIEASLRGGRAPLLPGELLALAPADVVLLDPPPGGRHRLRLPGGFTAEGPIEDGAFTVERTHMDEPLPEIPLILEVELARLPLTLAEVARLAPGAALPLPVDRRGLVALRLGDRTVARGELVELDGAVGVRVLSLEARP